MLKRLWVKFLVLLVAVTIISLSAALLLREFMIRDFHEFLEGEQEDHVYWVTADLEGSYETYHHWRKDTVRRDIVWAFMLGLEARLVDGAGNEIINTARALEFLSPMVRQRIEAITDFRFEKKAGAFLPYPLFLHGREIGSLELRFLNPKRKHIFLERSNVFLVDALGVLGGLAVVLSVLASNKLTSPLKKIAIAAAAISAGDLSRRVDISGRDELGSLSQAFNRMAQSLEKQETLRKKLISNVAHELRTPLAAMQGELEGVMDGLIPADKELIRSVYEESGRLKKMLEGMEELTQAQVSSLTLRRQEFKARPFLENILNWMGRTVEKDQITINLECDENEVVFADPDRLSQIVINLISNAMRAVAGGGFISVVAGVHRTEFILEVRDTGSGINKEDLPFIFERFYKASPRGVGIGLAIVQELVQAHGGHIQVESKEGQGATFIVHLPRTGIHNSS
jgi:signal transduction histidine kinase